MYECANNTAASKWKSFVMESYSRREHKKYLNHIQTRRLFHCYPTNQIPEFSAGCLRQLQRLTALLIIHMTSSVN